MNRRRSRKRASSGNVSPARRTSRLSARTATEELLGALRRARAARPGVVPEGSLLHATSEASLRRMLKAGKILPSVGSRDAVYGDAVYAEV